MDIDSFFKNKDKKKKSKKNNVIIPALLMQQNAESEIKKSKKASEKSQQFSEPSSELMRHTKEDDEWEDTGEQEVDISALRIGVIRQETDSDIDISNKPLPAEKSDEKSDTESENSNVKDGNNENPWSSKVLGKVVEPIEQPTTDTNVNVTDQSQKYVPPSQRDSGGDGRLSSKRSTKAVPNITNAFEFPKLGEAVADAGAASIDDGKGVWCKVGEPASSSNQKKQSKQQPAFYQPPHARNTTADNTVSSSSVPSVTSSSNPAPLKYVPPHKRDAGAGAAPHTHNRFAALRDA